MDRVRQLLTTALLVAFAIAGSWVLVASLVVVSAAARSDAGFASSVVMSAALELALRTGPLLVPALTALALLPRRPFRASVVATLYGLCVVGLTATRAGEGGLLLAAHLGGLLLALAAFPLGEPGPRPPDPAGAG